MKQLIESINTVTNVAVLNVKDGNVNSCTGRKGNGKNAATAVK